MTCIIGLVSEDKVYIGADSAASNGWVNTTVMHNKVFRTGEFLIGYTTSFRMGQLVECSLQVKPQAESQNDRVYLISTFSEAVRTLFKEHGYAEVKEGVERGGNFLIGYRGHLYEMQPNYSVLEHTMCSIGSGEQIALGAMSALNEVKPKARIKRALAITAQFVPSVSAPFIVERL